jgi:hemoglobin
MMDTMPAVSESQIVALVDAFYAKVRRDDVLAPVFERAIAPEAWPVHPPRCMISGRR